MIFRDISELPSDQLRQLRTALWITGLAAMALGVIGIVFPLVVTLAAELLFGGLLALLGLLQIIRAVFDGDGRSRLWSLLFGGVALAAGGLLLFYPAEGAVTLTIMLAIFFVAGGTVKLAWAWQMSRRATGSAAPRRGWGWMILSGALSCVLGAILLLGMPATAAWALGLLLGIDLLFLGISEIALAIGLSRLGEA